MAPILVLVAIILALPWLTGSTFGQQCAKSFERNSPSWERCVERMDNGGTAHFDKKIVLTPAE